MAAAIRLNEQHSCSFDHLVGEREQRRRNFEAERPGRLHVDDKLEFGRLQDREVGGLRALEDLTGVDADPTKHVQPIGPVAHQPSDLGKHSWFR
jgi:hypothetical protein